MSIARSGIDSIIGHIRDALWSGGAPGLATVMVGAGFSKNAIPLSADSPPFPLWNDLAGAMQARLGLPPTAHYDPLRLAQMFEATVGRAAFDRFLEAQLPDSDHGPSDLHTRLLELPWADVFSTNYDTLLERAAASIARRYERVLTTKDIPLRRAPRLVKLHGTIGTGGRLIATQEDYREYPRGHAPFVNLVRQAVMETVFVLVGFAGDDPNFLEWTGWVRDELGDLAPKIYLCGLLNTSPAELALLQKRQVTPLDLSPLFPSGPDRHRKALDWLIAALENGEPGRDVEWAPREPQRLKYREPPLPEAKTFTAFSGFPPDDLAPDTLRRVTAIWRAQRMEYPGWHVAPDDVRERIEGTTDWWRDRVFSAAKDLSAPERLMALFELCWRLELSLSPIFTPETDQLVVWLESVNPFSIDLGIPNASSVPVNEVRETRAAWIGLALHVLRTAREDLDHARFEAWRDRLRKIGAEDRSILAELRFEEAHRKLEQLDIVGLEAELAAWRAEAQQPIEFLRLAAFYGELGNNDLASQLAKNALSNARRSNPSAFNISIDAWTSFLLRMLHWRDAHQGQTWKNRLKAAEKWGYRPWETLEKLRAELKHPHPSEKPAVEEVTGFDPDDITRSRHFGNSDTYNPAWQLLRLLEKAPIPVQANNLSVLGDAVPNAAIWVAGMAPFWSFSVLLRADAKPRVLDEMFGREVVATIEDSRLEDIFKQVHRLVSAELNRIAAGGAAATGLGPKLLGGALEILSRITFRLNSERLVELLTETAGWIGNNTIAGTLELRTPLDLLVKRLIDALPEQDRAEAALKLLALRVPGEEGFPEENLVHWLDPFRRLWAYRVPRPETRPQNWSSLFERLLGLLKSPDHRHRGYGFDRLYFLFQKGWLNETEIQRFADAVWERVDSTTGLPLFYRYHAHVVLSLPGLDEHNGRELLKRKLLNFAQLRWRDEGSPSIDTGRIDSTKAWLSALHAAFIHPVLREGKEPRVSLSAEEAWQLLEKIIDRWPEWGKILQDRRAFMMSAPPEDFVDELCAAVAELILWLPPSDTTAARINQFLSNVAAAGFSTLKASIGLLHLVPALGAEITSRIERGLLSEEEKEIQAALDVVLMWNRAGRQGGTPPLPPELFAVIVNRVVLGKRTALRTTINTLSWLLHDAPELLTDRQEHELLIALDRFARETEPALVRSMFEQRKLQRRNDVGWRLDLRRWAARLASDLSNRRKKKGQTIPSELVRWQKICSDDRLPEVRSRWTDQ